MADVNALTSEARVKQVEAQITPVIQAVADLKIENNEQYVAAGAILTDVKKAEKAVKAGKEAITKPLNEALKAARAFSGVITALLSRTTFLSFSITSPVSPASPRAK